MVYIKKVYTRKRCRKKVFSCFRLFLGVLLLLPVSGYAHCPLCTAGAGVAALAVAKIGVGPLVVGMYLGAFAVAVGLWFSRFFKKTYIPKQAVVLAILSFGTTIFPLKSMLADYTSLYLPFWGEYGKTFVINLFIVGGVLGAILLWLAPVMSRKLASVRGGKIYPFQGVLITFALLLGATGIVEIVEMVL